METNSTKSNDTENSFEKHDFWTIHVETKPELPDEIFYIKSVHDKQLVGDFKKMICLLINRKEKNTKFYHEGELLNDENTLDYYNKNTEDVCLQHAMTRPSKNTIVRWFGSIF